MPLHLLVIMLFLLLAGCAAPPQTESLDYRARAETQVNGGVRVSAAVLSEQESENSFGFQLVEQFFTRNPGRKASNCFEEASRSFLPEYLKVVRK